MPTKLEQPKKRSDLRLRLGRCYYGLQRRWLWLKLHKQFAVTLHSC